MDTLKTNLSLLREFSDLDKKAAEKEKERLRLEEVNKSRARDQLLSIRLLLTKQYPIDER